MSDTIRKLTHTAAEVDDNIDEVVAARGSEESLDARLDGIESGVTAIEESLEVGEEDDAKVLTASYSGGVGTYSWVTPSGGGGGTSDYTALTNKPQINSITLTGNKSLSDLGIAAAADIPSVPITEVQKNGSAITPVSGVVNITVPTQASDINAATATQGGKADTAIQGIKVNSSTVNPDSNKVVSITVPTTAADVSALPDTTKYAAALSLTINSSTYVVTGQLKDQNGDSLGTAQTIDLPLESVVVGGSYNSQTKKVVLTLQNGNTIEFSVADLVSGLQTELSASNKLNPAYINYDSTHRAVSDTEKSTWNGKQNALTSAQLDAVNSGIDSTKVTQIATNEAALVELVDGGAKNALPYPALTDLSGTLTSSAAINADKSITITLSSALSSDGGVNYNVSIRAGTYKYSAIEGSSTAETNAFDSYIQKQISGTWTTVIRDNTTNPGNVATLESGEYRVTLRLRKGLAAGTYTFKPMLCSTAAEKISDSYVPYRPSEDEQNAQIAQNTSDIATRTGFGTAIPSNANLNDYTTIGEYYCGTASIAATLANLPAFAKVGNGHLTVMGLNNPSSIRLTQIWYCNFANSDIDGIVLIRQLASGSGWTEWRQFGGELKRGIKLASNIDLNDYTTIGRFYCASDSYAATIANSPTTARGYTLTVSETQQDTGGTIGVVQTAETIISNVPTIYKRTYLYASNAWSWTPWYKFEGVPVT